jgi:hypothetical protein
LFEVNLCIHSANADNHLKEDRVTGVVKGDTCLSIYFLPSGMKQRICLLYFVLMLFALSGGCSKATLSKQTFLRQDSIVHIYLLMGQSNMAGRGIVEPEDQQLHSRVFMLDKNNTWQPARDPMHFDKPIAGVGPGLSFGKQMAEANKAITIGLVPSAAGGSSIDAWKKGGYHDQTNSYPYDEAIKRAKLASQQGEIKGVIWHQGESDSKPGQTDTYSQKLQELIDNIRKELALPDLPFIVATLPDFYVNNVPEARLINQALQSIPEQVHNTACISTSDLAHKGDTIHFDSSSARKLGKEYTKAMQALQQKTPTK